MKFLLTAMLIVLSSVVYSFPRGTNEVSIPQVSGIRSELLQNIAPLVKKSIAQNHYPGVVILAAHHGKIIYKGVFGNRRIKPDIDAMQFNTIFDIASLTKVIATAPAIMQLVENGKLDLDASVAKYWPEFAVHEKSSITIRELLTHTSGLPPEIDINHQNKAVILHQIEKLKLHHDPGTKFLYSDVNFIILAHLVEIVSKKNFDNYIYTYILKPLQMKNTRFLPSSKLRNQIAPTELVNKKLRWGNVQDPIARAMGGISGHAGLFSTAKDLGRFAECLLKGGRAKDDHFILGPLAILKMTTPQTPTEISDTRGLGWDIDSKYSNRGVLFPMSSFGHTGWTGTSIWIDPATHTWIIILTNRLHPNTHSGNQLIKDRRTISNIISASITDISFRAQNNTGEGELNRAYTG